MPKHPTKPNRIPPFHAVAIRARRDGWTPLRQAEFIGHLAETRCVRTAAGAVGMSRETAYRLRARDGADSFCAAWDAALIPAGPFQFQQWVDACERARAAVRPKRKVTVGALDWRSQTGIWSVLIRRGRYVGVRRKADNSALLMLVSRLGKSQADWETGITA